MNKIITAIGLPGSGKEQPNSEPVLTPSGFVPIGSLKVGDFVIGSNGQPTQVVGVYPQGLRKVFEIKFQDSTSVKCGLDHLWVVQYRNHGVNKTSTWPLSKLLTKNLLNNGKSRYKLPSYLPQSQLGVELNNAWAIGYALGNGCFKSKVFIVSCHANNRALVKKEFDKAFNCEGKVRYTSKLGCQICYPWKQAPTELQAYKSQATKEYTNAAVLTLCSKSRKLLLAGLIDSDGHCSKRNSLSFANTSYSLIKLVIDITRSLGGRALEIQKPDARTNILCYNVCLSLPAITLKIKKYKVPHASKLVAGIVSINELNYKEESTCIKVAAADCLYVTNNFKLTHNTSYCKTQAQANHTWYRPEPTDDVDQLRLCRKSLSGLE